MVYISMSPVHVKFVVEHSATFVVCALATVASLEFLMKCTQKGYHGCADKQTIQSRVYTFQRGYCPDADLLGQWRKS